MRFSASMIDRWMRCPKQAHFKEVLKLPEAQHAKTTFGTCVHDALELYNNSGNVDKAIARFKETWDDPSILNAEIDLWPQNTNWGDLRERGIQAIMRFHEDNKWETRTIVASEHPFNVPFGDHRLSGFIDCLEIVGSGKNKELRIIDYKTSSYTPNHLSLRMNTQFTVYMYASTQPEFWTNIPNGDELFKALGNAPRRGVWYSLWQHRMTDVGPRDDLDLERLYRVMLEIERAKEAEVYVPNISGESCMWCAYTNLCAATIPLAQEVAIAKLEHTGG